MRGREIALLALLLAGPLLLVARSGPAWSRDRGVRAALGAERSAFAVVRAGLERADPSPCSGDWSATARP